MIIFEFLAYSLSVILYTLHFKWLFLDVTYITTITYNTTITYITIITTITYITIITKHIPVDLGWKLSPEVTYGGLVWT